MLKTSFLIPISKGVSYPTKLQCMTPNVANVFSHSHEQRGNFTQQNSSIWLQMLQTSFLIPISKGRLLPNQTPVHDCKCCKCLFSFPFARVEAYPTKLHCNTVNVTNDFPHSLKQVGTVTQPNFSAWLQMLQTSFLIPISKEGVLPNQTTVHN